MFLNECLFPSLTIRLLIDVAVHDGLMGWLDVCAFYPSKVVATGHAGMSERVAQGSFLVLFLCVFAILVVLSPSI